jgi:uncharacterized membrane protein YeaQ/YmgE (transglycosylase-associated protein family)
MGWGSNSKFDPGGGVALFGTAMGMDAADGCCCFPMFGYIGATVALAIVAVARRSAGAVAISLLLASLVGAVVVSGAVNHELQDSDDSRGVHAMLWEFVWWWVASLFAPLVAAALLFRTRKPGPVQPLAPRPNRSQG